MFESSNYEKIVLLDFGISKIFKENLDTNITALSYYYSPPEISDSIKSRVTPNSLQESLEKLFRKRNYTYL